MMESKAVIKYVEMPGEMKLDAIDFAVRALEKYNVEKEVAADIKQEFDKKYTPTWHCMVGRNMGYRLPETKPFIFFYLNQVAIFLFKVD